MFLISSCSCLLPLQRSQALSLSLRCSWSSADRRCSNHIWAIDNFIDYKGAPYIGYWFSNVASDWLAALLAANQKLHLKIVISYPCFYPRIALVLLTPGKQAIIWVNIDPDICCHMASQWVNRPEISDLALQGYDRDYRSVLISLLVFQHVTAKQSLMTVQDGGSMTISSWD